MSITTTTRSAGPFAGDGSIVTLPFEFKVFEATDLLVGHTDADGDYTVLTLSTDYTVALNADQNLNPGGEVTLLTALAVGESARVTSDVPITQPLQLRNAGPFLPAAIEDALDRVVIAQQQVDALVGDRSLRVPIGETVTDLPAAGVRAGKLMAFDDDGNPTTAGPVAGTATALAAALADTDGADLIGRGAGTVEDALTAVEALATDAAGDAAAALLLERAVINVLPNTRWYVSTAIGYGTKIGAEGNPMASVSVSSYTTGSNTVVCTTSDTKALAVGMLVAFSGSAHANLKITPARITALVTNTSFTVRLPNGLLGASSAACTATPTDVGGAVVSIVTSHSFDHWTKATGMAVWRDSWSANVRGGRYALGMKKGSASAEKHYVQFSARDLVNMAGRTMVLGVWMKNPTGGSWRLFTSDNVNGERFGTTVTATGYTWAEFSFTVPANPTSLAMGWELIGASGLVFYASEPFAGQGSVIGPTGGPLDLSLQRLVPVVKYSPISLTNANITFTTTADAIGRYSFLFDAYAETGGQIAPEVRALDVLLEGIDYGTLIPDSGASAFVTRDANADPLKFGPIMFQQAPGVKTACGGVLTLDTDGTARIDGTSGRNWANVSMDINGMYY
jgi:hypothetical protein